jgi:hypothetical protein
MGVGGDGFCLEDSFQRLYSKELDLDEGMNAFTRKCNVV